MQTQKSVIKQRDDSYTRLESQNNNVILTNSGGSRGDGSVGQVVDSSIPVASKSSSGGSSSSASSAAAAAAAAARKNYFVYMLVCVLMVVFLLLVGLSLLYKLNRAIMSRRRRRRQRSSNSQHRHRHRESSSESPTSFNETGKRPPPPHSKFGVVKFGGGGGGGKQSLVASAAAISTAESGGCGGATHSRTDLITKSTSNNKNVNGGGAYNPFEFFNLFNRPVKSEYEYGGYFGLGDGGSRPTSNVMNCCNDKNNNNITNSSRTLTTNVNNTTSSSAVPDKRVFVYLFYFSNRFRKFFEFLIKNLIEKFFIQLGRLQFQ